MLRDKLIEQLEALDNLPVFLASDNTGPSVPITDVIATPRGITLWASLEEEEEESLLSIDIMQDENEHWRLVVFDKLNKRTAIIGPVYKDFLHIEYIWTKCVEDYDGLSQAFVQGPDAIDVYLQHLDT